MRRTLCFLLLLVLYFPAAARAHYDTTYIRRPEGKWIIRTRTEVGGGSTCFETAAGDDIYKFKLAGDARLRQHIGFGYKNFILGIGINISGKKIGWDTAIRMLGNRFGMEITYSGVQIFNGNMDLNGDVTPLPEKCFRQTTLNVRNYFAFNGRKFSMPAVMTQGFRQYRSAGSALLTAAFTTLWLTRKTGDDTTMPLSRQVCLFAGAGGGYGYNWVSSPRLLLHLSLTENIGAPWSRSTVKGSIYKTPMHGPAFLSSGRAAVFFYPGKWYFGLAATAEYYIAPAYDGLHTTSTLDFRGIAAIGVRF